MWGCGYEEKIADPKPGPWAPSGYLEIAPRDKDDKVIRPNVCVGYTRRLPLTQDVTWDLVYAEKWGILGSVYGEIGDEQLQLMKAATLARAAVDNWCYDNPPLKKPGQP